MDITTIQYAEPDMCRFAQRLALLLTAGDCLTFYGDLGAGKTTFIRAMIQSLVKVDHVPSPTFTLVQTYPMKELTLWHFDLYRLKQPDELYELGFEDALIEGIAFIEWPERAKGLLPDAALALHFASAPDFEGRIINIKGDPSWATRLAPLNPV